MGFTDQAIEAYQRAVELKPDFPSVWESLGRIYKEKGKYTQADFAFSQAIAYQTKQLEQSPRAAGYGFTLWLLGNMYREAGNMEAAKQTYLRDIRENPEGAMSLPELKDIYLTEGNEKAAFDLAYQIMLLKPNHRIPEAEAWDFLASWYYQHNRESDGYRCSVNAQRLGFQR